MTTAFGAEAASPQRDDLVDSLRNGRDGRYIERVGYFNPIAKGGETRLHIENDRIDYWLGQGALASERVTSLIKSQQQEQSAA